MKINGYKIAPRADLRRAILQGANLQGAILQGAILQGADLREANLQGANLQGAILREADLREADLRGANLQGAILQGAILREAILRRAILQGAILQGADLREADLREANLQGAILQGANLQGADLREARLPDYSICPEEGQFIGWKKLNNNKTAKLLIPAKATRTSSLVGRKCRAEFVKVLEISDAGGKQHTQGSSAVIYRTTPTTYTVGEYAYADKFDDDIRVECTHGIHFFITRKEAEEF